MYVYSKQWIHKVSKLKAIVKFRARSEQINHNKPEGKRGNVKCFIQDTRDK